MPDPEVFVVDSALQVNGQEDTTQLIVQGHTTQNQPLQSWQDVGGNPLAQISADGRLQVGEMGLETEEALVEANADITLPSNRPQRGWQSLGQITGALANAVVWAVNELKLLGSGGVSGVHTALRAKVTLANSGSAAGAEIRAGEFEAVNTANPLNKVAGVVSILTNQTGGNISEAAAFKVGLPVNEGSLATLIGLDIPDLTQGTQNYAIRTGDGRIHFGDFLEMEERSVAPTAVAGSMQVYPKTDGKLYAKNASGAEYDLTVGSDQRARKLAILGW